MAAAAHFCALWLLVEFCGANATAASAIGFCVATVVNYSLQYHWTFRASGPHSTLFWRYLAVSTTMLGVNTALFWTLCKVVGMHYLVAQIVATGAVVVLNFTINRRYTFVAYAPR